MLEQEAKQPINFSSFTDWCRHKDSLSEEARHTVEALLKQAKTSDYNEANKVLSNFIKLNLVYDEITDLAPLSALTNLTELSLEGNQINDITPLSKLTNLTNLSLYNNQITDITSLSGLTNLTDLYLNRNKITDITSLLGLTNLRELNLSDNQITDITPVSGLTNLRELILYNNQISDITPLSGLTNLTILCLHENQITDITPLSGLTNLTDLYLSNNKIIDITPLSGLTNLTKLFIDNNKIIDITPLSGLTNLTDLSLTNNQITELNLSIELIQNYLTISTVQINNKKARETVKQLYAAINRSTPKFIVCSSPQIALITIIKKLKEIYISQPQISQICAADLGLGKSLLGDIFYSIDVGFSDRMLLWDALWNTIILEPNTDRILVSEFEELLDDYPESLGYELGSNFEFLQPLTAATLVKEIHLTKFFISKFGVTLDEKAQEILRCKQQVFEECGWILPFEKICLICDRPSHLRFDSENRLHAEGEPAIAFADGYNLYFHHGVKLPEQYGKIHPDLWQAEWLLSEENAELRRLLIERIGYDRICQQLQALELDTWQEYTLLKIDNADIESIYLLKMTCPSTGHIHTLRVPPDLKSAKEAIRWVNWDIDPEEFSVQT